ncbi:MAG: integrase core domain-containing protein [[Eubacterium] siraeum]
MDFTRAHIPSADTGQGRTVQRLINQRILKYESFEDFEDAKIKLDKYRDFYNTKRPHYALNLDTP